MRRFISLTLIAVAFVLGGEAHAGPRWSGSSVLPSTVAALISGSPCDGIHGWQGSIATVTDSTTFQNGTVAVGGGTYQVNVACHPTPTSTPGGQKWAWVVESGIGSSGGRIDVHQVGMQGDNSTDNCPFEAALMNAVSTSTTNGQGAHDIVFPPNLGADKTVYNFSCPLHVSRNVRIICPGGRSSDNPSIILNFTGGLDGVIFESASTSSDGGNAGGAIVEGCALYNAASPGVNVFGSASATSGQVITSSFASWQAGDGIVGADTLNGFTDNPSIAIPAGAYLDSVAGSSLTVNAAFPLTVGEMAKGTASISDGTALTPTNAGTVLEVNAIDTTTRSYYAKIRNGAVLSGAGITAGTTVSAQTGLITANTVAGCTATGSITGTNLTLSAVSAGSCVKGMTVSGNNVILGTTITGQTSGTPYGAGVYTISNNHTISVPSEAITIKAPALGGVGLYTVNNSQLVASETITFNYATSRSLQLVRLPAAMASHVTTTTGSPTVTVVSGPSTAWWPGDFVWSDAFPLGATVAGVTGAAGSQTLTMLVNASVTHTSGSGLMWSLPVAIKTRVPTSAQRNFTYGWFAGWVNQCSGAYSPTCNGNNTQIRDNYFESNMYGAIWGGDISGASLSEANNFRNNRLADLVDVGTVASTHIQDVLNSIEPGAAPNAILTNCAISASVYIGMYTPGGTSAPPCIVASNWASPPTAPSGTAGGGPFWLAPNGGTPSGMGSLSQGRGRGILSWGVGGSPCPILGDQSEVTYLLWLMDSCGVSNNGEMWKWNSNADSVDVVSAPGSTAYVNERYPGANYIGYTTTFGGLRPKVYPWGVLIGGDGAVGHERMFTAQSVAPTYSWHQQGDFSVNTSATAGSNGCWFNTAAGANWYPSCPISNKATAPDYTMVTVRSGSSSNQDITGRIALSSGAASYSLTQTYSSAPNCGCWDVTTPANACSVSESTTTLTFAGTGTDTVKWICIGRN